MCLFDLVLTEHALDVTERKEKESNEYRMP